MRSFAASVVGLACLAMMSPPPALAQSPTPFPAPAPQPTPTTLPSAPPAPPPAPLPLPAPTPAPTPTPTPLPFRFVLDPPAPAPGAPAIVEIAMNDQTLHAGGPYIVRVTTSLDVTTVNVTTMGQTFGIPPAGPGRFFTDGRVPSEIPFFLLNRWYTLTVTAQAADGRATSIPVQIRLER